MKLSVLIVFIYSMVRSIFLMVVFFFVVISGVRAQTVVPVVRFDALQTILSQNNDTTYVVNFWATWCKPCIEEMPFFVEAANVVAGDKVRFVMVSLDMPRKVNQSLYPWLAKNKVPGQVILLNDPDANTWIPQVDSAWDGAIPVTLFFKGNKKEFVNESFDNAKEILAVIKKVNN